MKIIFFTDAHGNGYAIDEFFKDIKNVNADLIIFGGDIFGYYYQQEYIINKFKDNNVKCLLGNHDRMFLELLQNKLDEKMLVKKYGNSYKNIKDKISQESVNFFKKLHTSYKMEVDDLKLFFTHGSLNDNINGRIYPDTMIENPDIYCEYDYVFLGHTHHKMQRKIRNTIIINPGSIGQQRDGKGCSYIVFDTLLREIEFKVVKYDKDRLKFDIKKNEKCKKMKGKLLEVLDRK